MTRGRIVLALLAILLGIVAGRAWSATPQAADGHLVLPAPLQERTPLQGQWRFAWHRFVDPSWQQLPPGALASVPSSWNELTADGKEPGPNGWGSYLLQVDCPAGQSLAIEPIAQRTASRIFINGTEVAAHGRPGTSHEASWAAVFNRVPISREFACPLRITVHMSNFDHRGGGFVRPMFVGSADALAAAREWRVAYDAALLAAYLLTGAVALMFFVVRRREWTPLLFGLFCVAMGVYGDMIGERLLLRLAPPQVSWFAYMRLEYLSWIAAMALFLGTLRALFPLDIHRRLAQAVLATLGLASLAVLVLPPETYSYLAAPGQAIAVLVGAYLAWGLIRALRRDGADARVLLAGMVAVVASLAVDLLLIDVPGPDRKFGPFGFALFLLSPAIVITRRMSRALNAEERSRTLEENARLREDVERMSRHDLKTPLTSILGASRLLRDSTGLTSEQRELAGVVQRAALRMLEMVNLSLGLFRMETGSYDFRPQPVDLREVVTRVLVDLQPLADGHGVTLHVSGSDGAPALARGEELLCYSIVANLVKNAIEATPAGGQVSIGVERGDPVVLSVHNPGEVPSAIAARFFDKYVTSGKSAGTGLGTYSARLMARVQEGELALDTGPGGTTLTLTLRAAAAGAPQAAAPEPEEDEAAWAGAAPREVLLVDDDEFVRLVMRRFLPSPPFLVTTAANGHAAMEAMARRWPDDLLIDMEMPRQDGLETLRWVRRHEAEQGRPRCRIVMLSGNDDPASQAHALAAGADRFLSKPVSRESLLATLRELAGGPSPQPLTFPAARRATDTAGEPADDDVVRVEAEWLELFPKFLRHQQEAAADMERALAAGDRPQVRFLAHRSTGTLFAMGLHAVARRAQGIERNALDGAADDLAGRIAAVREHLARVRFEAASQSPG